jgi:methanethiol S-methyltransferase
MVLFLLSFALWALVHSLTASAVLKEWAAGRLGNETTAAFYRLGYTVFALLTFLPVLYFWWQLPTTAVWQVDGVASWVMMGAGGAAVLAAGYSLVKTQALSFAGFTQAMDYLAGRPVRHVDAPARSHELVVTGMYAWMRHPLYTFSMVFLWANPTMSVRSLMLATACTLYFVVGSIYEEQRLLAHFGEAYAAYQKRVPRFIPRPWG